MTTEQPNSNQSLLITRKEIIELIGRSPAFVDKFIRKSDDFPEKFSHGCYKRKEVYDWLKKNNLM